MISDTIPTLKNPDVTRQDERQSYSELLVFAQAVEAAQTSGFPLAEGLQQIAHSVSAPKARQWLRDLSFRLAEGHNVSDAVHGLARLDPLLAALISVPEQSIVPQLLQSYERFLLHLHSTGEKLRSALLYPLMMLWFGLANIVLLNLTFLPLAILEHAGRNLSQPWIMHVLAFLDRQFWPQAMVIPGALLLLAFEATRLFLRVPTVSELRSPLGNFLKLGEFIHKEEEGRLLLILSLLLEAKYKLPDALRQTARFAFDKSHRTELTAVAEALEQGRLIDEAFCLSRLLEYFSESWQVSDDIAVLVTRFRNVATLHFDSAGQILEWIPFVGLVLGLGFVGLVVLLLAVAFFQPYFHLIGAP